MLKELYEFLKQEGMVSKDDIAKRFNKDPRYTQGYLSALNEFGVIETKKKGQIKFQKLTPRGKKLIGELFQKKISTKLKS